MNNQITITVPQGVIDKLQALNAKCQAEYGFDAPIKPLEEIAVNAIVEGIEAWHGMEFPDINLKDYQVIIETDGIESSHDIRHLECDLDDYMVCAADDNPTASSIRIIDSNGQMVKGFYRDALA